MARSLSGRAGGTFCVRFGAILTRLEGRPLLAGCRSSRHWPERPLIDSELPSRREGPLWIVEPPFVAADRLTANDLELTLTFADFQP